MAKEATIEAILERIQVARNFDFRSYKRATLTRRVERRMAERRVKTKEEYLELLVRDPHEIDALISSMLIKVTGFFRDREVWEELATKVLPPLIKRRRGREEIRVWSAGCATGEEAYSIVMLLIEVLGPDFGSTPLKVFGTDVDEAAIAFARRGIYSARQMEDVSPERRERFFTPCPEGYTVKQEVRRALVFGVNNLAQDAPISHLDLILCRNVFIYLNADLQRRVLTRFHYALRRGGILVLGKAELIPLASKLFEPIDLVWRFYCHDGRRAVEATDRLAGLADEAKELARQEVHAEEDMSVSPRDVLNAVSCPMVAVTGEDGRIALWNAAAARTWARVESDVLGRTLTTSGLPGFASEGVIEASRRIREGVSDREVVDTVVTRGGSNLSYTVEITPLPGALERQGLLYSFLDASAQRKLENEMKRATREIEDANERLRASVEQLRASNEELETTNEELQSANEELQTTNEELQSTNEELETTNEELQSANEELDEINRELAVRTEQMNTLALHQRTIIRSLAAAVVVLDPTARITSWNLAAERLLGLSEAEALGQTFWTLHVPALPRALIARIRRTLTENRALRDDVEYQLPTGGPGHASMAAIPLLQDGQNLGTVLVFEDTTRSTMLNAENQRLRERKGDKERKRVKEP